MRVLISRSIRRTLRIAAIALLAPLALCLAPRGARAQALLLPVERSLPPMRLVRHEQDVRIQEQVARVKIRQVFASPIGRALEATFLFPVPSGAQVPDFAMRVNGAKVHAETLESGKAREVYEEIVRRLADPGLVEYMDENLLRVRVFPVPAHGEQEIEIELVAALPSESGAVRYEFPFGASVAPGRTGQAAALEKVRLSIEIESENTISNIYSPSHEIEVTRREGGRRASVRVAERDLPARRDFTLYYTLGGGKLAFASLAHRREPGEPGAFLFLITPPPPQSRADVIPRDLTFVLDVSGAMAHNGKLDQAREALIQCVGALGEEDRFRVITFSTDVEPMSRDFLAANSENRKRAEAWLRERPPRGGTNIEGALREALAPVLAREMSAGRLRVIVFLTDGIPTVGETTPKAILRNVEDTNTAALRIFPLGLGYDVNARLLDDLAAATSAAADYVKPGENIESRVTAFFDKVSAPTLTNCRIEVEGAEVSDLYPRRLPDLFAGQQLLVFGRYRRPGEARVILRGERRGKEEVHRFTARLPEREVENRFVETLWGTRKIGYLLDEIRRNGESEELRDEVIALAKKYNVVTPYTSFLVTEDEPPPQVVQRPRQRLPLGPGPYPRPTDRPIFQGDRWLMRGGQGARAAREAAAPFSAQSGERAVEESLALRDLKQTEKMQARFENEMNAERFARAASGKVFALREGGWTDEALASAEAPLPSLKIRFGSAAWFESLRLRPDLGDALKLGDRVILRLERVILEIGAEGKESLEDADRSLLRKR